MEQLSHIVGFTRGGTSWIKAILSNHPEITPAPGENVLFRDNNRWAGIKAALIEEFGKPIYDLHLHLLTKAPLDAMHLDRWQLCCSKANIIFMMRDPRDCVASHHFGNRPWMHKGNNATPEGVMNKLQRYYKLALPYLHLPHMTVVKYEDLQIAPFTTVSNVFINMGIDYRGGIVNECVLKAGFKARTGREPGTENPKSHLRKGIMGDWKRMDFDFSPYHGFIRDCGYEI